MLQTRIAGRMAVVLRWMDGRIQIHGLVNAPLKREGKRGIQSFRLANFIYSSMISREYRSKVEHDAPHRQLLRAC